MGPADGLPHAWHTMALLMFHRWVRGWQARVTRYQAEQGDLMRVRACDDHVPVHVPRPGLDVPL